MEILTEVCQHVQTVFLSFCKKFSQCGEAQGAFAFSCPCSWVAPIGSHLLSGVGTTMALYCLSWTASCMTAPSPRKLKETLTPLSPVGGWVALLKSRQICHLHRVGGCVAYVLVYCILFQDMKCTSCIECHCQGSFSFPVNGCKCTMYWISVRSCTQRSPVLVCLLWGATTNFNVQSRQHECVWVRSYALAASISNNNPVRFPD